MDSDKNSELKNKAKNEKWICIYPSYLDKNKKVSEGRKVGLEFCIKGITCAEIEDALKKLGLNSFVEVKSHF